MKSKLLFFAILFCATSAIGQSAPKKIKVVLLGTFHFGETSDRNTTNFEDLFSEKRQKELDTIALKLNNLGIDKIFVEVATTRQNKVDSLFKLYQSNLLKKEKELRPELVQVAFRTAAKNNTPLVAADFNQELPYNKIAEYEAKHKNDSSVYPFFDIESPFKIKRKPLKESSLLDYYIERNNSYSRQVIMYDYLHYALGYGVGPDYTGENLTSVWYDRNLKIFTNILRQIDVNKDHTILVLFGSAHTAVFRQFFDNHPVFEIVELENVFK
jgi:Skp family chaperone for outer membrane proteins